MATVFMKWLESSPKDYERGIQMITLGRIRALRKKIVSEYLHPEMRVLDLGCGPGELTKMMAAAGARVSAVDASAQMLAAAEANAAEGDLLQRVDFHHLDAAMIDEVFPPHTFDLVVCSMLFSALGAELQDYLLRMLPGLLAPGGKVVVIEEASPRNLVSRIFYRFLRLFVTILTWLLTRSLFSQPLEDFTERFSSAGYQTRMRTRKLMGSLVLFEAEPLTEPLQPQALVEKLTHQTTPLTLAKDLLALFFRMIPPYPKVRPGLYAVGDPGPESPVLVTGNFDLTIRRLVMAIDGQVDCWVLAVDSGGINVWCAAGGGFLTAEKVIGAIKTSRLAQIVNHKSLILPQLAACGVDGWKIRETAGWGVTWGPVRAADIPAFLGAGAQATEEMRRVRFPLLDRLEMLITVLSFYALLILLPVLIFWPGFFWETTIAMLSIGLFYALTMPVLPGKDGLQKSLPLAVIVLAGFLIFNQLVPGMAVLTQFRWGIGLAGLSLFTAAEMQGSSPLMRGEQANWIPEAILGAVLLAVYFLVPLLLGWNIP